jgi:uncharacterized BrkB/YihY/UPF0761 family membrane protein
MAWSRERKIAAALLGSASTVMLAPLIINMFGRPIPMVQDLGFSSGKVAPWPAWAAALVVALAYIAMTFRYLPEVRANQHEIS